MEPFRSYQALRMERGELRQAADDLVAEVPLSISVNGEPLTITMQTPGSEHDLVRGLLYTEGIWKSRKEEPEWTAREYDSQGYLTAVDIAMDHRHRSAISRRSLLSVAACGICGKTEFLPPEAPARFNAGAETHDMIHELFRKMGEEQHMFHRTGGCHAAAAFHLDGSLLCVREDIGRHNAVDKVIGALLREGRLTEATTLAVSGRVSYEIVAKAFAAGIPVIAAVSSVSTLAVDMARECGITLAGFCREGRATFYSYPSRLI